MKKITCAFTGHRPQKLPFRFNEADVRCVKLKEVLRREIVKLIEEQRVEHFISGMALGTDMFAAEIVLDLKKSFPWIILECAIPCETQAVKWSESMRERYFDIASKCDIETMIQRTYTPDCMHRRNRYMVEQADYLIAVWSGSAGGTQKTIEYAQRLDRTVAVIDPETLGVRYL